MTSTGTDSHGPSSEDNLPPSGGAAEPVRLSVGRLVLWLIASAAVIALFGAFPAWKFGGWGGLLAGAAATGLVFAVFVAMAVAVKYLALRHGPVVAAKVLATGGLGRMLVVAALALLLQVSFDPPGLIFWPWVGALYFLCAVVEAVWAAAGLAPKTPRSPPV
jgi:hypothetical protein